MSELQISNAERAFSELNQNAAAFRLTRAECFLVHGPDSIQYAHGRTTQNIKQIQNGESEQFMLLEPKGQLQSFGHIARIDEQLLVVSETADKTSFAECFLQFKVADQLELVELNESHSLLFVIGQSIGAGVQNPLSEILSDLNLGKSSVLKYQEENLYCLATTIGSLAGYFLVVKKEHYEDLISELSSKAEINSYSDQDFELSRISLCIPHAKTELLKKCIATDFPYQPYISFEKGCYSGQEVVEMSTARGRPNRRVHLVHLDGSTAIAAGTAVHIKNDSNENTVVGAVSSTADFPSQNQARCLIFIKNKIDKNEKLFINDLECKVIS